MHKNFFIVGTDTDVGKTVVTAGLAMCLSSRSLRVGVMKPVASGCVAFGDNLVSKDAVFLMEAAQNQFPALTSPIRLKEPLTPFVAAEIENVEIDISKIFFAYRELTKNYDMVLVEGIGGLLVPLKQNYMVSDLIQDLKIPVIVVGRIGLGTINHTLLTIEALRSRGIEIAGVILNGLDPHNSSPAELTNPRMIEMCGMVPILGVLPKVEMLSIDKCFYSNLKDIFEENINVDLLLSDGAKE